MSHQHPHAIDTNLTLTFPHTQGPFTECAPRASIPPFTHTHLAHTIFMPSTHSHIHAEHRSPTYIHQAHTCTYYTYPPIHTLFTSISHSHCLYPQSIPRPIHANPCHTPSCIYPTHPFHKHPPHPLTLLYTAHCLGHKLRRMFVFICRNRCGGCGE